MTHLSQFDHPWALSDCPACLLEAWLADAIPGSVDAADLLDARHQQRRHIPQPRATA